MNEQHTTEPWKVLPLSEAINQFIVASAEAGLSVADCDCPVGGKSEANARRIVACVNACAGLRTDLLEKGGGVFDVLQAVAKQRDELLAALEDAERWLYESCARDVYIAAINEAIAKCKKHA